MIDPVTWFARRLRSEVVHTRLRRVCPHPAHRIFEFEEPGRSGIYCDDCQGIILVVRVPLRARLRARSRASQ